MRDFRRILLVAVGGLLMAVNIKTFVSSASLIPGGFSGVTLLLQNVFLQFFGVKIPYSLILYAFNIIPVVIGFRFIGKKFTLFSVVMIVLSGFMTDMIPKVHLTDDPLLCSVFGGVLNAIAVSFCLFADSSSGGTDFIAIFISEKTGRPAWNYILCFNICILVLAGLLFGWDKALYSIIFQYASTQSINLIYKKYSKTTLLIITDKEEEVYQTIKLMTNHDATVFTGKGSYSGKERKMLYSVVSSSETGNLERAIRKIDPNAFINVLQSKEIIGRFFKRAND